MNAYSDACPKCGRSGMSAKATHVDPAKLNATARCGAACPEGEHLEVYCGCGYHYAMTCADVATGGGDAVAEPAYVDPYADLHSRWGR